MGRISVSFAVTVMRTLEAGVYTATIRARRRMYGFSDEFTCANPAH